MPKMNVHDMVRGLVRAAEFAEQEDGGKVWDDEVRIALDAARERGWGLHKIGSLDDPPEAISDFFKGVTPPSIEKMFPNFFEHMIGLLVQQAISKLPREKKVEVMRYLAEVVWPGSTTKREGNYGG